MREVYVTGAGITKFGFFPNKSTSLLSSEAILKSLNDSDLKWQDIQAAYCGSEDQGHASGHKALMELGMRGFPIVNVENACSSGSSAFRLAYQAVAGGQYDTVLCLGFEKMPRGAIPSTAFRDYQLKMGFNFQPANYAMETLDYFNKYGATIDDVSLISILNRKNGELNPNARFQKKITLEEINNSKEICYPFRLLHCSATSDGAVAFILSSKNKTKNLSRAVKVKAAVMTSGVYGEPNYVSGIMPSKKFPAAENLVEKSAKEAYKIANVGPEDIDIIQAYDSMAAGQLWDVEDLGFCSRGEAPKLFREGYFDLNGIKPCNTDGGIMSRGHAIGATGAAQIYEIMIQLRGEAGARQVQNVKLGLTHANGAGPNSTVVILEK